MWIDTHAHLADLSDSDLTDTIARAHEAGVDTIINTATDLLTAQRVLDQTRRFPHLRAAVGISPFDVEELPHDWAPQVRTLAAAPEVIAIGEVGLDCSNPRYPAPSRQLPILETQIQLACALNLPLIVHSRGAESRVVDIMKNLGARRVLFHCFTGNRDDAQRVLDEGYAISLSGIVTFKKSPVRELLRYIPRERLFIETDTPYLAPVPHRGRPNQPAWVAVVGEYIAATLDTTPQALAAQLAENFRHFFGGISPSPRS